MIYIKVDKCQHIGCDQPAESLVATHNRELKALCRKHRNMSKLLLHNGSRMNTITCKKCGSIWNQDYFCGPGPLKCRKCGKVAPCSIKGIGGLRVTDLGPEPDQWGWCHTCHKMTQDAPGAACFICATPRCYNMCPRCNSGSDTLIQMTKPVYNSAASQEWGSECYDWQEEHKCLICGRRHWIGNANY